MPAASTVMTHLVFVAVSTVMVLNTGCRKRPDQFEWVDTVTVPIGDLDHFINSLADRPVRARDVFGLVDACYWLRSPEGRLLQPPWTRPTIDQLVGWVQQERLRSEPSRSPVQRVLQDDPWTARARAVRTAMDGVLDVKFKNKTYQVGKFRRDSVVISIEVTNKGQVPIVAFTGTMRLHFLAYHLASVEFIEFEPVPVGTTVHRSMAVGLNAARPSDARLREVPPGLVEWVWEPHTIKTEDAVLSAVPTPETRLDVSCWE